MKIAVLGLSATSVVACDAIRSHQHDPVLVLVNGVDMAGSLASSPLNDLNFGYPGAPEDVIKFHIHGNPRDWDQVHPQIDKAGMHAFEGLKPVTSDERILSSLGPGPILSVLWDPAAEKLSEALAREVGEVDAIINTIDRNRLCDSEDHQFILTRVWWSEIKGPKTSPGHVVYNASEEPSWAIASNIDGRQLTVWDSEPPYDDVYPYDLPTRTTCTCEVPGIGLHVGRSATYRPISLAESYEQVVEFLYNPLNRLVDTDPTLPMEPIREND